ncbi:YtzH-like family protein [Peribacillus sp. SCS-155]|uniref:YtzH-like family protein n=1 Tax=Peribacillus sedimenti TaxID=3115297 RepID=UPI003905EF71
MPLSHSDQFSLLKDILQNHETDCCGSIAECEQVERLVKSLMVNSNINNDVKTVLEEIYRYSQNGINSSSLDDYIHSRQHDLSNWVDDIERFS